MTQTVQSVMCTATSMSTSTSMLLMLSRGFAHLAALGLVSMMLRCVIVKTVELVDLINMRKIDCFGETRLVPHVPSAS